MSFQFPSVTFFFRLLCTGMLTCMVSLVSGQTTILNGDGTNLTTTWCHEDTIHRIIGQPAGGIFSGCGVTEMNGEWYFNPVTAAGQSKNMFNCELIYTPPGNGAPVSRQMTKYPKIVTTIEDQITCDGSFYLLFHMSMVGAYTWYWTPGANLDDSTQQGTAGTTNTTQEYVVHFYNPNYGCNELDTVTVYYEGIDAAFSVSKDTLCMHEEVFFTAENLDPVFGYTWLSGDGVTGTGETWQHVYHEAGVYEAAHILNNEHCYDTLIRPIVVKDFTLELTATPMRVDRGAPFILQTAAGEPYYVTAWRPAELLGDQRALSQQVIADTTRTYTVIGQSAYGCVDSAEVTVEVNPIVYLPSSFTPNGDGKNDFFRIVNWGDPVIVTQFRIYDRWGREVWSGTGANAFTGWDGNYNGGPAEMGVYYYVFEGQLPSGAITAQQGDVTLLR